MEQYIYDKYGQRYRLIVHEDSKDFFSVEVRHKREWVGKVECKLNMPENNIVIEDLEIRNDSDLKLPFPVARPKGKLKNYRGRGLGTALLNLVVSHAISKGLRHICGSIIQEDVDGAPNLIEFYQKRGFKRVDSYPGCLAKAIMYLCMNLADA